MHEQLRSYRLTFRKTYQPSNLMTGMEVSDFYIKGVIRGLQKQYKFEILSCQIRSCAYISCIYFRCSEHEASKVADAFRNTLGNKVIDIKLGGE